MTAAMFEDVTQKAKPNGAADPTQLCLTPADWAARNIPPQDRLLGDLFSTTTRCQLAADTGLGKTMFGLALNFAMRLGQTFLHWRGHRESRILIVDGEMPKELIKDRIAAAASWFGIEASTITDGFYLLSREDVEGMPPLDTPEGARWIMEFIERIGGVDHATFDNIAALTTTCLKEEDGEAVMKDLRRVLTKACIGQFWLHHTGHDGSRGYGIKMREWHLDTVMVGERIERPDTDVAFALKFSKARRRTPENRADFENVELILAHGQWTESAPTTESPKDRSMGRNQHAVYDAATKLLAASTKKAPPGHPAKNSTVVHVDQVKDETRRIMVCEPRYFSSRFSEAFNGLTNGHRLKHYDGWVWLP